MRNNNYTARRRGAMASDWVRNRNTVRHTTKTLGTLSLSAIMGMLVLIVGLIYVTQGTRATGYDYELSSIDSEIEDLEAQKEDLAVEKARMTAVATTEESKVAMAMGNAEIAGHAEE